MEYLNHLIFKISNKFFPREITDYYVSRFMNIPMKIGGGKHPLFNDFSTLAKECTNYASEEAAQSFLKCYEEIKGVNERPIGSRERLLFSSLAAALMKHDQLAILDFGGCYGNDYLAVRNFLGLERISQYIICENSVLAEAFKRKIHEEKLMFVSDVAEIPSTIKINFVYLSGTLQYLEKPQEALDRVLQLKPEYLFINRTPFWDKPHRLTKQLRPWTATKKKRWSYPCWILNEQETTNFVKARGYSDYYFDNNYDKPYITGFGFLQYKSYFFKHQNGKF